MAADVAAAAPADARRRRWGRLRRRSAKTPGPDVVICGCGVGGLQLTLAGQAAVLGSGSTFTVGVPPQVPEYLRASRVQVVELDEMVAAADNYTDGYLAVVDAVLAAASSPPAVLVVPGSPMIENSITRALVTLCRQRDLQVEVHASVSPIDALVNDLGLDVTGRGLQVFSAPSFLARGTAPNPVVPLIITGLDTLTDPLVTGSGADPAAHLGRLQQRLAAIYPGEHPISLVSDLTGRGSLTHRTLPLAEAAALWADLPPGAALYVNPRAARSTPTTPSNSTTPTTRRGETDE